MDAKFGAQLIKTGNAGAVFHRQFLQHVKLFFGQRAPRLALLAQRQKELAVVKRPAATSHRRFPFHVVKRGEYRFVALGIAGTRRVFRTAFKFILLGLGRVKKFGRAEFLRGGVQLRQLFRILCGQFHKRNVLLLGEPVVGLVLLGDRLEELAVVINPAADLYRFGPLHSAQQIEHQLRSFAFNRAGGLGIVQPRRKLIVESVEHLRPLDLAGLDFIELLFHLAGERHLKQLGQSLDQQIVDLTAEFGRNQRIFFAHHIVARLNCLENRSVGRRSADAVFLQLLNQRGFGKARRRFSELLLRLHRRKRTHRALRECRKYLHIVGVLLVASFVREHGGKSGEDRLLGVGAQRVFAPVGGHFLHVHRQKLHLGRRHLAGDKAVPDQRI